MVNIVTMYNGRKVVVTFTSWTKRIGNCVQVVKSVLANTIKPDAVYLNLSEVEFPKKCSGIPEELVKLEQSEPTFKINWVSGPNSKTMKKVFPVLQYLEDDDIIIYIDDDFILPQGFVKSRIDDFMAHGGKYAISSSCVQLKGHMLTSLTGINLSSSSQPASLVTKRMLQGHEVFSTNMDVYNRAADDSLYTLLVTLNGFSYVPCSDYGLIGSCQHRISNNFNTISPLKTMGVFKKNGYSRQNTYITHLLYLSLVAHSPQECWNADVVSRMQNFHRLPELETGDFNSQIKGFETMDINGDYLTYWYWRRSPLRYNAGDDYNKFLMESLYDCKTIRSSSPDLCLCGSILTNPSISRSRYVVGAGIQAKVCMNNIPRNAKYLALRGEITKKILQRQKINVDDNVLLCDPGLLLSLLYAPGREIEKKHDIGIVAHYYDEAEIRKILGGKYHIISMDTSDIRALADEILSCRMILSSSLHGIIFSHSYGVPAYHIQLNDFFNNGNFKFADYYSSFEGLKYRKFRFKSKNLDVDEILKFHQRFCGIANPSKDAVSEKQQRFLAVLPYRKFLRKKYGGLSEQKSSGGTDNSKNSAARHLEMKIQMSPFWYG